MHVTSSAPCSGCCCCCDYKYVVMHPVSYSESSKIGLFLLQYHEAYIGGEDCKVGCHMPSAVGLCLLPDLSPSISAAIVRLLSGKQNLNNMCPWDSVSR